jgi:heat-inducible transcriptional repressor
MLDDRAHSLLKTLVERYIADGQPVGSRTLSRPVGAGAFAGHHPQRDGRPGRAGPDRQPAHQRRAHSHRRATGCSSTPCSRHARRFDQELRRLEMAGRATSAARPAAARHRPRRAGAVSLLSSFVGVVTAPRKPSVFHHIEFLRLASGACW